MFLIRPVQEVLIIENSNEERPHFTGNCILYFSPWMKIEDIIKFVYGEMPNEDYERIKHVAFQHQCGGIQVRS